MFATFRFIGLRLLFAALSGMLLLGASLTQAQPSTDLPNHVIERFGTPPAVPSGPLPQRLINAVETAFVEPLQVNGWGPDQTIALDEIVAYQDPRLAWHIADLLRFASGRSLSTQLSVAAGTLLETNAPTINQWGVVTDYLIAWDIPEPPNYLATKAAMFSEIVPQWEQIFVEGDVDWRHVSWGGVFIDDRPFGTTDDPCNCIPAADNPIVTSAEEATWLDEDAIVFGIVINGEARAYPRRIMEVREMVNDTLGGRDLGIPYCTLCGAAQAYYTDEVPNGFTRPTLRTSGLLIRSNKVMFDLETYSVFDTFTGKAVTGPLADVGVELRQANVITTRWRRWKETYPETTVLAEELALGRDPDFRNGRDANGPIFPVGDIDPRLPAHEDIVGVIAASGQAVAFPQATALIALQRGEEVGFENIRLALDAGGIKAVDEAGVDMGSHQAFWFAWSQFHPETALWSN